MVWRKLLCKVEGGVSGLGSWVTVVDGESDNGTGADKGWRRKRVASWRGR